MHHLTTSTLPQAKLQKNALVSYDKYGSGPPLILVHGSFSDHQSNWAFVKPLFEQQFTVYAIARRGRGETVATVGHSLDDESQDVVALIQAINEPVFLLGHSYGAQIALAATAKVPARVSKLVLYEAPDPQTISQDALTQLNRLAQVEQWEDFTIAFFRDTLLVPVEVLDELKATEDWRAIVADAKASLADIQALSRYNFTVDRFRELQVPVLLQIGTASPRNLYITDALAAVLPNVHIEVLLGQAHEGMTTAPEMYTEVVSRFLLETHV